MSGKSGKGKMRAAMDDARFAQIRADAMSKSAQVAALPEFQAGTLTRAQTGMLRGDHQEAYTVNFFKRYGYVFPGVRDRRPVGCGRCLSRAMGYEEGYISEEDLRLASEARVAREARKSLMAVSKP